MPVWKICFNNVSFFRKWHIKRISQLFVTCNSFSLLNKEKCLTASREISEILKMTVCQMISCVTQKQLSRFGWKIINGAWTTLSSPSRAKIACRTGVIFCVFQGNTSPRTQLALRTRLAFASARQKYAKNYACSAGYAKISTALGQPFQRVRARVIFSSAL